MSSFSFCLLWAYFSFLFVILLSPGEEEPNDDERFALISSLKKVSIFYNCHDMGKWNIWDGLLEVRQMFNKNHDTTFLSRHTC